MTLQLQTTTRLFDLHCSVAMTDWDMDKELKLATTTDQFCYDDKLNDPYVSQRQSARASRRKDEFIWYDKTSDTFVKPNLWLLVNPNIACPIQYRQEDPALQTEPAQEVQTAQTETQRAATAGQNPLRQREGPPTAGRCSAGSENKGVSGRPVRTRRKGRIPKLMDTKTLKPGCWPRPPVNYCILIALALKSSNTGSLKVQQIYNFTREHFPFFQTAPDGWKNTIRHNLCFNSSFRKTCNMLFRDGKRKSCFWHLTLDGHRRLRDELDVMTGETLKLLERSMSQPDLIWSLFEM